jgi:acyl CoA:acetate/3-ketoacid CoA transferase alpha subunit
MTSFLSLYDAVAEYVYDGATIAMEGFTQLFLSPPATR